MGNDHVHVADDSRHVMITVVGQAKSVNYSYNELSYMSAKLIFLLYVYRSSIE